MSQINQFSFINIWNNKKYKLGDIIPLEYKVKGCSVFCGKDFEGNCFFVLKAGFFVAINADRIGKLKLSTKFSADGEAFLFITLVDAPDMDEFFGVFAASLISKINESSEDINKLIRNYCGQWEILFKEKSISSKAIGILGELYVLNLLLKKDFTTINWNEGYNSPQDFYVNNSSFIEVKTTINHSSYVTKIHGIEQLNCPENKKLFLFFVRMSAVQEGEYSIKKLCKSIPSVVISNKAIDEINALPKELIEKSFDCIEFKIYQVDKFFPKITKKELEDINVLNSVVDLEYELNLQGICSMNFGTFVERCKKRESF